VIKGLQLNGARNMIPRRTLILTLTFLSSVAGSGCSPVGTAVKIGMQAVGTVVADEETSKLGEQLIGKRPSAADAALGQPVDVWRDVHVRREWRAYSVPTDVLNRKRYVVEVGRNRIVDLQLIEKYGNQTDLPLELIYFAKVKGASPRECETALGFGPPLISVRSTTTNVLLQIYDARPIKELSEPHNCLVRFDSGDRCAGLDLIEVQATAGAP
jgi:hypothetical protein